jgi:hypothetical protein
LSEITSFELDSSRSRKSVFSLCSHNIFWNKELNQNPTGGASRVFLPEKARKRRQAGASWSAGEWENGG